MIKTSIVKLKITKIRNLNNDWTTLKDFPMYEADSSGYIRNKKTKHILSFGFTVCCVEFRGGYGNFFAIVLFIRSVDILSVTFSPATDILHYLCQ